MAKIEEDSIPGVEGLNDFKEIGYGGHAHPQALTGISSGSMLWTRIWILKQGREEKTLKMK